MEVLGRVKGRGDSKVLVEHWKTVLAMIDYRDKKGKDSPCCGTTMPMHSTTLERVEPFQQFHKSINSIMQSNRLMHHETHYTRNLTQVA